jgi:glutamyl-Q tRNA(Asp) synthetase
MIQRDSYRGRFAPTPSGPLHLGSLVTAVAGWLQARRAAGAWLLRIDDLDRARCPRGADAEILRQLEAHGLTWDETPRYQAAHVAEYRAALERLGARGSLYRCACTRATLKATALAGADGPVYAGTCRSRSSGRGSQRLRTGTGPLCIEDGWLGRQCRDLERDVGDIVVQRADGQVAYQLASVVDEQAQRITEVVRGLDLLGSTFQQRWIQSVLGLPPPACRHLPVLVDEHGRKLSKQNHAPAVDAARPGENLWLTLALLGQAPPAPLRRAAVAEVLGWGLAHWDAAKVPRSAQIVEPLAYNAVQQTPADAP